MKLTRLTRQYTPRTFASVGFLATACSQAISVIVLESFVLGRYLSETVKFMNQDTDARDAKAIPTYFSLVLFAELFGVLVAWDSLRQKNTIQLLGLVLYHL